MKYVRILSACALIAFMAVSQLNAQHTRKVLMEEFTAMTCPPCAQYKPGIDAFAKTPNVITVTYHQNYPAPGDPYNMMDANVNAYRHNNVYGLNSIPHVFLDGKEANLGSAAALAADAAADLASSSPLLITINEDRSSTPYKVTVKVRNDGTAPVTSANLQIMVVNYYADLSKYPDVVNNAYTRYTDFDYCILKALPTITGTTVTIGAGEEKTFNYNYTMGTNAQLWNSPYVIAFVQDPGTKEVFQAESNFDDVARHVKVASNDAQFQVSARSKTVKKTFTLTNPTTSKITASVALAANQTMPATWGSPSLSSASVAVPAKGTATVDLNFNVGTSGGSYFNTLVVMPTGAGINVPDSLDFGYVAENTTACLLTQNAWEVPGDAYTQLNNLTSTRNEVAYIPAKTAVFEALSNQKFNTVVVAIDYAHRYTYVTDEYATVTRNLFENGTNLFFFGEVPFTNAMLSGYPSHEWSNFMTDLGITGIKTSPPLARFTQSGSNIALKSFTLSGVKGDVIGNNLSFTANTGTNTFCLWTEDLTYTNGVNKVAPFLAYADVAGSHAGIHLETDKAKAVFLGFNVDGIAASSARAVLYKSVMDWFMAAPDLKITATTADTLNFGDVNVNAEKTATAVLRNIGSANLVISSVDLGSSSDYQLTWSNPVSLPMTIAPGATQNVVLNLKPLKEGAVSSTCTFTSNAKSGEQAVIQIRANATTSSLVAEENSVDGTLSMHVAPNPIVTNASIQFSVNSTLTQTLNMQIVDAKGVVVREIMNNDARSAGVYTMPLNCQDLASGSYRLILRSAQSAVAAPFVVTK